MKKLAVTILIICLYGFPFVYYSMHKDFTARSMSGYLLMLVLTSLIAYFGGRNKNLIPLIIGNIASFIMSYHYVSIIPDAQWGYYFKPLTPKQLLITVSILNLLPQYFGYLVAIELKRKKVS